MPEYLTPGVYLEETSFRSSSIEGVRDVHVRDDRADPVRPGAVQRSTLPNGASVHGADAHAGHQLHRVRAGLRRPRPGRDGDRHDQLPRLRGTRVLRQRRPPAVRVAGVPVHASTPTASVDPAQNFASLPVGAGANPAATWRARWPGDAGKEISVECLLRAQQEHRSPAESWSGSGPAPPSSSSPRRGRPGRRQMASPPSPPRSGSFDRDAQDNLGLMKTDGSAGLDPIPAGDARHITLDGDRRVGRPDRRLPRPRGALEAPALGSAGAARPLTRPTTSAWSGSTRRIRPRRATPTRCSRPWSPRRPAAT